MEIKDIYFFFIIAKNDVNNNCFIIYISIDCLLYKN